MKRILSFGGGVNSTAILALCSLKELPWPDLIIFSDTGAEWPHTYKYIDYLEKKGIQITRLTGGDKYMDLIEFCQLKKIIPSRVNRWCTDHFKRIPINYFVRSLNGDSEHWIGFDFGETKRMEGRRKKGFRFPLFELRIDRIGCEKIIRKAGWGVPKKSGCFICPFQRKSQWIELKKNHPDLWKIAVDLEREQVKYHSKHMTYIKNMMIEKFVSDLDAQIELPFDFSLDQKCECYFD